MASAGQREPQVRFYEHSTRPGLTERDGVGVLVRFDMMGRRLYKTYVNLTNIIVRVSDGTEEGKEHAVLVNSHVDSTLPSPGAADDGLSVGVMLESIRVLVNTPAWEPKHAIVFCEFCRSICELEVAERCSQCSIMQRNRCRTGRICSLHNIQLRRRKKCISPSVFAMRLTVHGIPLSIRAAINLEGMSLTTESVCGYV